MSEPQQIYRVLVVDDEPLARQRLVDLFAGVEDFDVVGEAENGRDAVEAIDELRPDVVFLDVQMPALTGPEVVQAVGPDRMPVTVFVTAFDQYAVKAFDLAALDYLLKPFDDDRFEQALDRARSMLRLKQVDSMRRRLLTLLEGGSATNSLSAPHDFIERLAVEMRGQIRVIPVDQIEFFTASGPYVELHVGEQTFIIRERMQTLEDRLDPSQFVRIHRSAIVRIDQIDVILHSDGGDYAVRLRNGKRLKVSRGRRALLNDRLGISHSG